MSQIASAPPVRRPNAVFSVAVPALVLALLGGVLVWRFMFGTSQILPLDTPAPISSQIEDRYGVRITQIGLTADGGLLDMRFIVIDPDKAEAMMADLATLPVIVDPATGTESRLQRAVHHTGKMEAGRGGFILYTNPKGTFTSGHAARITIGSLRLEPIVVK